MIDRVIGKLKETNDTAFSPQGFDTSQDIYMPPFLDVYGPIKALEDQTLSNEGIGTISIISPEEDDAFAPGNTVLVHVEVDGTINSVLVVTPFEAALLDFAPYEYSFTIPEDEMGDMPISVEILLEVSGESAGIGSHTADQNGDSVVNLTELLRVIQFFNIRGFHCVTAPETSEDGFLPGAGGSQSCAPHASDYNPQDWQINLTELLRLIQFFNIRSYHACPGLGTEDGYCPGPA